MSLPPLSLHSLSSHTFDHFHCSVYYCQRKPKNRNPGEAYATEMESKATFTETTSASFPNAKPHRHGVWAPPYAYGTALGVNYKDSNKRGVNAEGQKEEANAIGDPSKTTETGTRSPLLAVYACTGILAPKLKPTNQIRA